MRLIETQDPYTDLEPGALGTIALVDDAGTLHVDWDNGASLGLIPGVDRYTITK